MIGPRYDPMPYVQKILVAVDQLRWGEPVTYGDEVVDISWYVEHVVELATDEAYDAGLEMKQ